MRRSVQLPRGKPSISRTVFATAVALTLAAACTASASETRSYVLSSFANAAYSTKDDCQGGIDPDQYLQYAVDLAAQGLPQDQINEIMAEYHRSGVGKLLVNRG